MKPNHPRLKADSANTTGLITIEQAAARLAMTIESFMEWLETHDVDTVDTWPNKQYAVKKLVAWRDVKREAEKR